MRGISQLAFAGGLGIGRQWKWHRPGNRMPVDELAIVKLFPKHVLQSHVYDTYRYTHTHAAASMLWCLDFFSSVQR